MKLTRRLLLGVTALLLCAAAFAEETTDLRKWIPGNGMVYGEISSLVIQRSPLYARLSAKYPAVRELLEKGRGQLGGYDGELDRLVVMFNGDTNGFALLCSLTRPVDAEKLLASLEAKGLKDKYEKISVCGKAGYLSHGADTAFGRTCVVLLSDRLMLICPEKSAEALIRGEKLSPALADKLATGADGVFFRIIPGTTALPPEADIKDFTGTGTLTADESLELSAKLELPDAETAKMLEQQVRQGLMLGIGVLFADDSELGMDLMNQVKIKRTGASLTAGVRFTEELIERLVSFQIAQAEKRAKEKAEREKRREERRRAAQQQRSQKQQQGAPQQKQAAPAASGTTTAR